MLQSQPKGKAPAYIYHDQPLTVEYSFSEYKLPNHWAAANKLWLDILFVHPQLAETVTIRIAKSTLILCQSKEVIEALVHREIRLFLQQAQLKEYGTAHSQAEAILAFC